MADRFLRLPAAHIVIALRLTSVQPAARAQAVLVKSQRKGHDLIPPAPRAVMLATHCRLGNLPIPRRPCL